MSLCSRRRLEIGFKKDTTFNLDNSFIAGFSGIVICSSNISRGR